MGWGLICAGWEFVRGSGTGEDVGEGKVMRMFAKRFDGLGLYG